MAILKHTGITLLIALAYIASGYVGLELAIPPKYATVIWPPSGIALAALLIWGPRHAIGVFLGSFVVNIVAHLPINDTTYSTSMLIGVGAALQALGGYYLVKHFLTIPNNLDSPKSVCILLFWGAIVASLINPTIGVTTLALYEVIPPVSYFQNWVTWWGGDVIGVITMTPLLLLFSKRFVPQTNLQRQLLVTAPMLVMLCLLIVMVDHILKNAEDRAQRDFERLTLTLHNKLGDNLQSYTDMLYQTKSLFLASDHVSREEFQIYTNSILKRLNAVQAVEWAELITHEERARFVAKENQRLTEHHFYIKNKESDGTPYKAPEKDIYIPLVYINPLEGNVPAYGYDITDATHQRKKILLDALANDVPYTTPAFNLVQLPDQKSVVMYMPVVKEDVTGFVVGVFVVKDMLSIIQPYLDQAGIHFSVRENGTNKIIYNTCPTAHPPPMHKEEYSLNIFGREWHLTYHKEAGPYLAQQSGTLWLFLMIGILTTGLLCITLILLTGQNSLIRRRVEESTEELDTLLDNIPLMVWVKDMADLSIIRVNKAAETILKRRRHDLLGRKDRDLFLPAEARRMESSDIQTLKSGVPSKSLIHEVEVDNKTLILKTRKVPIMDLEGKPRFLLGISEDITKQEAQRQQLLRNEKLFEQLNKIASNTKLTMEHKINAMLEAGLNYFDMDIAIVSRIDGALYTVQYCRAKSATNIEQGNTFPIGHTFCQKTYNEQNVIAINHVAKSEFSDHPAYLNTRLEAYIAAPLYLDAEIYGTVNFSSNRKHTPFSEQDKDIMRLISQWVSYVLLQYISQMQLEEYNSQLEQSNEELEEFAYIASHDLKEPLRGISNYTHFIQEDYGEELNDDIKNKLSTIETLSEKMESIIYSLLHFSQIRQKDMQPEAVDVNAIIQSIKDLLKIQITDENVEIIQDGTLPSVVMDRSRLEEIFRNLIMNGIKYNDSKKKVIQIGSIKHKGQDAFYVKDNGIGIKPKHHKDIFKIFKRLHDKTAYGGGTGSGLALIKKIIERNGGEIWLKSEPGKGTTFYFTVKSPGL